jgi:DNA-binding response OmpR family regulator
MATKRGSSGVVLVIEDDPAVRMVIELAVEADGLVVHGEGNGKRALEWLEHNRPAIVLLDLDLPGVNGAVIAADVRQRYGQSVPILVTSGLPNCRQIANRIGATGCLAKPFDLDVLTHFVRGAVIDAPPPKSEAAESKA